MSLNRSQLRKDTKNANASKAVRRDSLLNHMTHMPQDMVQIGPVPMFQGGGQSNSEKAVAIRPFPRYNNPQDSSDVSTVKMRTETLDGKNWIAFPTIFPKEGNTGSGDPGDWLDYDSEDWRPAYEEALRRGEIFQFGEDKQAALDFGMGSWKPNKFPDGGEAGRHSDPYPAPTAVAKNMDEYLANRDSINVIRNRNELKYLLDVSNENFDWDDGKPFPYNKMETEFHKDGSAYHAWDDALDETSDAATFNPLLKRMIESEKTNKPIGYTAYDNPEKIDQYPMFSMPQDKYPSSELFGFTLPEYKFPDRVLSPPEEESAEEFKAPEHWKDNADYKKAIEKGEKVLSTSEGVDKDGKKYTYVKLGAGNHSSNFRIYDPVKKPKREPVPEMMPMKSGVTTSKEDNRMPEYDDTAHKERMKIFEGKASDEYVRVNSSPTNDDYASVNLPGEAPRGMSREEYTNYFLHGKKKDDTLASKEQGGEIMELDDAAIEQYRKMGYVVEEIDAYPDGGQVISEHGWDYTMDPQGNYKTRKTGNTDWITPSAGSGAYNAIAEQYGSRLQQTPSTPIEMEPASVQELQPTTNEAIDAPFIRDFVYTQADLDMLNAPVTNRKEFDSREEMVAFQNANLNWDHTGTYPQASYLGRENGKYILAKKEKSPYCPKGTDCLANAFDAYEMMVGSKYNSKMFPSEQRLKKSLGIESSTQDIYDNANEATKNYLDNSPYMNPETGDFTADSWDIHGVILDNGGTNLFTSDDNENKWGKMSDTEKAEMYAKIPVGAIIGMGGQKTGKSEAGYNNKYGLATNRHSGIIVGHAEDGVPIMFDQKQYIRMDQPNTYNMNITNISYPKEMEGKTHANLAEFNESRKPTRMNFDYSPLIAEGGDKEELDGFYKALSKNKVKLMNDLNIPNAEYDDMSKMLMAISMEETKGGNSAEDFWVPDWAAETFGETQGLTQLNIKNILNDEQLAPIAKKYGITEEGDLFDPEKAAVASMIYATRNKTTAEQNYQRGVGGGERVFRANDKKWYLDSTPVYTGEEFRTDEGTVVEFENAFGMNRDLKDINEDFNRVAPGRYEAFEKDGEILVRKKTLGNGSVKDGEFEDLTPQEKFAYNWQSPYTLSSGDAQGGSRYVRGIMKRYEAMNQSTEQTAQRQQGSSPMPRTGATQSTPGPLASRNSSTFTTSFFKEGGEVKAEDIFQQRVLKRMNNR